LPQETQGKVACGSVVPTVVPTPPCTAPGVTGHGSVFSVREVDLQISFVKSYMASESAGDME
jgi:hypothetical protein